MCGRYTLTHPAEALAELLAADAGLATADLAPRWNIAPTQVVPIVRQTPDGRREAALGRWGLVPAWADDPAIGNRLINARAETVDSKPAFRDSFRAQRCLIPADGFYEWRADGRRRQPIYIRRRDGHPFAFAGLWSRWRPRRPIGGPALDTFTILTTEPSSQIAPIHDRMPLVLRGEENAFWLEAPAAEVREWLHGLGGRELPLETFAVHPRVNSPKVDDARCIEPLAAPSAQLFRDLD
ncbi:MAG: SOS response-associated peptidase [Acidobacteriota bacterium]